MKTVLQAMAQVEGFYKAGSRPQRNNNPGDLSWGSEAKSFGATKGDPRFAVFPEVGIGWRAFQRWLSVPAVFDTNGKLLRGYLGATLEQVIHRFAPPIENDSDSYVATVCNLTGLQHSTKITQELLNTPETSA